MSAPHADPIIAGYMARLKEALSTLPAGGRDEIMAEIQEHITQARAGLSEETDVDVLDLLDRIGNPADIAEEAQERLGVPERGPEALERSGGPERGPGPLEIGALLVTGLSGLILPLPPVG